ncbi:hypothetical protein [Rubripirellula obstinata]|nr:hypothetical protein [Rubripirellula obstinata]
MRSIVSNPVRSRTGGVLIEAIVASMLLVTATTSLTRFVVSSRQLGIAADQQLAAKLVTENAIERLRSIPAKDWPANAESVAKAVTEASGISTQIEMSSFQIDQRQAWHATIRSQIGKDQLAVHENHAWKVVQ